MLFGNKFLISRNLPLLLVPISSLLIFCFAKGSKELIINDDDYYLIWLRTLEEFLGETVKIQSDEIIQYFQDWRAAFLNTPHGQPVKIKNLPAD